MLTPTSCHLYVWISKNHFEFIVNMRQIIMKILTLRGFHSSCLEEFEKTRMRILSIQSSQIRGLLLWSQRQCSRSPKYWHCVELPGECFTPERWQLGKYNRINVFMVDFWNCSDDNCVSFYSLEIFSLETNYSVLNFKIIIKI